MSTTTMLRRQVLCSIQTAFEHSPGTARPSTITTYQNIQVVQQIEMRHQQISLCTVCLFQQQQFISNDLGMKKMGTNIVHTYSTFSDCCQELLQESEVNSDNYSDRIVTSDEICLYDWDHLSE